MSCRGHQLSGHWSDSPKSRFLDVIPGRRHVTFPSKISLIFFDPHLLYMNYYRSSFLLHKNTSPRASLKKRGIYFVSQLVFIPPTMLVPSYSTKNIKLIIEGKATCRLQRKSPKEHNRWQGSSPCFWPMVRFSPEPVFSCRSMSMTDRLSFSDYLNIFFLLPSANPSPVHQ